MHIHSSMMYFFQTNHDPSERNNDANIFANGHIASENISNPVSNNENADEIDASSSTPVNSRIDKNIVLRDLVLDISTVVDVSKTFFQCPY